MNDADLALRDQLGAARSALIATFQRNGDVDRLLRGLSTMVDRLLRQLVRRNGLARTAAVIAVGGYGRGQLFPHSDVDILIVPRGPLSETDKNRIEELIRLLWDLGLHLGHSVRTIDECNTEACQDVTVLTSMLEARLVIGPRHLYEALGTAVSRCIDRKAFFQAKMSEQRQRHYRYQESPYSLEPNCKDSPGGLRDLQMLLWVARASGFGTRWSELEACGLMTPEEARALLRNERILKKIRAHLHIITQRHEDRLVFDVQDAVANAMSLAGTSTRRPSEVLMQRYYWAAKAVWLLNTILLQNMRDRLFSPVSAPAVRLDETFIARNEVLDIDEDHPFERDRNGLLRAFLLVAQHEELKGMSVRLLRALWHGRVLIDTPFRRDPKNRATFLALLQVKSGVLHELRRMNQLAVLGRYLPVFRRIVGQMQHDLFHVYTVDQHSLQVLRNLRRFSSEAHAHEYPLCSQLMAAFDRPWLLYIAALFHDIAKGRGGDHSELGAHDAKRFCRDHRLSEPDTNLVVFLVLHHLKMSEVAQKQDIADPDVIARFAQLVQTQRRLSALYLFTVADIRGTSPKVWNAWKARLLEDLFQLTQSRLGGEQAPARAEVERRKQRAIRTLRLYGLSAQAHEPLWNQLDLVYFLRHSAQEIAWHTRTLLTHIETPTPIVRTRLSHVGAGTEVLIYARDRKDLFARICSWFDGRHLSIADAKIHTTQHGWALDTLLITDDIGTPHDQTLLNQIESDLTDWIGQDTPLPQPHTGELSRQSRNFPISPEVNLQPDEAGKHFVLSITATDRVGLLYTIAHILTESSVNVHTAKINTLGERVEDVFLVDGALLNHARGQLQLEHRLLEALAT